MSKMQLNYSPITHKIMLGRIKGNTAQGEQRDVTNNFLQVMEMKFPINTSQNVSVNGVNKYRVIILDMEKEITINGKAVDFG